MNDTKVQRTFIIGDEWSYFKIYTGFKTADTILTNCIYPLSNSLEHNGFIDKWFFIRYSDPKFHLRLRFHTNNSEHVPIVITRFNRSIKEYVDSDLVWKVQTDTYSRELERYGINTIEATETLFHFDSKTICKLIMMETIKKDETMRWLLGLKMIDCFLNDFSFTLSEKLEILNTMQDNFGKEFGITKEYRHQFGQKYRSDRSKIENILDNATEMNEEYKFIFEPIFEKSLFLRKTVSYLKQEVQNNPQTQLKDLVSSYIHMMLNRLFRTQQRTHELIIYDYLFRYYTSMYARTKIKEKKPN